MLENKKLFILDMDGVIFLGQKEPIPSGIRAVQKLRSMGKQVVFLTNNSSKSRDSYKQFLSHIGITCEIEDIYTSGYLTAQILSRLYPSATIFVIGEEGLISELKLEGFKILNEEFPNVENEELIPNNMEADLVVVGWDRKVTYNKLRTAMTLIKKGAKFYATNDDASFPAPNNQLWPGTGAIVAFLSTALNEKPEKIFGKPNPEGILSVLKNYNILPSEAVLIGDRLNTDILGGNRAGIVTIAVETGINNRKDLVNTPHDQHPTYFFTNLDELL
ncbi:HAD-IIA family hydrolase [Promethearchaeum syntrophicum]|uniref:HAD-IIA family hydrolase n=1 Tax=Promethearchaeum syntrophicum TaxID=2594042 RepID=A0A5B9DEX4_9ARCH|nr:HAD-IIA family hydrolase [Candidatus Prometheoarchaeum syntrophicum]QEE17561.1 putative HAD-hydrolase [Candidatus Prometheoarchaeum syntrophicum]